MNEIKKKLIVRELGKLLDKFKKDYSLESEMLLEHEGEYYPIPGIGIVDGPGGLHIGLTTQACPHCEGASCKSS